MENLPAEEERYQYCDSPHQGGPYYREIQEVHAHPYRRKGHIRVGRHVNGKHELRLQEIHAVGIISGSVVLQHLHVVVHDGIAHPVKVKGIQGLQLAEPGGHGPEVEAHPDYRDDYENIPVLCQNLLYIDFLQVEYW